MKYLHCGVAVLGMFVFSCQENKKSLEFDKNQADLRFEGNRQMALILDSLNTVANFQTNYFLSGKRAEQLLINKPAFKSGKEAIVWNLKYAFELLNSGNAHGAIKEIETFLKDFNGSDEEKIRIPQFKSLYELLAVAYLRHGENENCVANHNSESCILPLKGKAIHVKKNGSQQAMRYYAMLLEVYPDDIQLKWLFNIAAMTLGDFPQGVPEKFRIDFAAVDTKVTGFTPLYNAATDLGVDVKGLSGAGIIEDFNGDGFMDVFASSYGIQDNATLFFSDGKGGFIDVTDSAQLRGITVGLMYTRVRVRLHLLR